MDVPGLAGRSGYDGIIELIVFLLVNACHEEQGIIVMNQISVFLFVPLIETGSRDQTAGGVTVEGFVSDRFNAGIDHLTVKDVVLPFHDRRRGILIQDDIKGVREYFPELQSLQQIASIFQGELCPVIIQDCLVA